MKIAISTDAGEVSSHFGRCPEFTIVEINEGNVVKKEVIPNPGHKTGYLPKFFHEMGVSCVIASGAGFRAQQFFEEFKIELILGVQGSVEQVIEEFIKGKIQHGESTCAPGKGKGYGVEKEDSAETPHHHVNESDDV